ncbi:hypothetical protein HN51_011900 [Arachis hypogaea]
MPCGNNLMPEGSSFSPDETDIPKGLISGPFNQCPAGHEPFVSYEGLEQLHRFLFVLGITHVLYSCLAVGLAMSKVIHQKYRISYYEIINDLCPILSIQQLYRICSLYWDANYNTRSVSPDVLSSMRMLMVKDSNNAQNDSFLLDDSSSIPFSVDDLSISLQEKDFLEMKLADELLENPDFQFLNE